MSTLSVGYRAPILDDGDPIESGEPYGLSSSDPSIVSVDPVGTPVVFYAKAESVGTALITVTSGSRSGSVQVDVLEAPLNITLGEPEPVS